MTIEFLRYEIRERQDVPLRSNTQWRCRRKQNTANVRRACKVKEFSRAKSIWHEESNKIVTVLNNIHQFKIAARRFIRSRNAQKIIKHISDGFRGKKKPKTAKTKEAKDFRKSEVVHDTFQKKRTRFRS